MASASPRFRYVETIWSSRPQPQADRRASPLQPPHRVGGRVQPPRPDLLPDPLPHHRDEPHRPVHLDQVGPWKGIQPSAGPGQGIGHRLLPWMPGRARPARRCLGPERPRTVMSGPSRRSPDAWTLTCKTFRRKGPNDGSIAGSLRIPLVSICWGLLGEHPHTYTREQGWRRRPRRAGRSSDEPVDAHERRPRFVELARSGRACRTATPRQRATNRGRLNRTTEPFAPSWRRRR